MLVAIITIFAVALCGTINAHPNLPEDRNHGWRETRESTWLLNKEPNKSAPSATRSSTPTTTASSDNACNSVRKLQSSFTEANPSAIATVPAQLAYECITSVPFNSSAAVALLDSIRPFLDWQSTLQYVKDPPAEYAEKVQRPYDFWAEWDRVYATAKSNSYDDEYQFGYDLYAAFQRVHDGHFGFLPDSATGVFLWKRQRRTALVSVSVDGTTVPDVYVYDDILATVGDNSSYTPSPLVLIDGRNSTEYLLEWSQHGGLQDPDALWNALFYSLPYVLRSSDGGGTGAFTGGLRGGAVYPGPNTTLTFANGTSSTYENSARVLRSFENVTSGVDLYKEFFMPTARDLKADSAMPSSISSPTTTLATESKVPTTTANPVPGYPTPVIRQTLNQNSGYFLDGEGYDDVAVLSLQHFTLSGAGAANYQAVNTYFLERAVAENKTKLIIDISANGGGHVYQGYDLFLQLFPHITPRSAQRMRVHEALDYTGREISHFAGLVNRTLPLNITAFGSLASFFNYRSDLDASGNHFQSWDQKSKPELMGPQPDAYTPLSQCDISDDLMSAELGIEVTGHGNRTNITQQKFEPDNIILVTDGFCASTCAVFSELMRRQAGVKSIALGGRPHTNITQAVGGVKGGPVFTFEALLHYVRLPFEYQYLHSAEFYNKTVLAKYNDLSLHRGSVGVVNLQNSYRYNDSSDLPLQFRYEPADCRILYTPHMAVNMTTTWKTVADTAFNGVNHCVAGGL